MKPRLSALLVVVLVTALATWAFGWWAPALTSVLFGALLARERAAPTLVGAGSLLGWALLLVVDQMAGRLGVVATTMGRIFGRGPGALLVLTLLVPLLLGLTGAELGRWLKVQVLDHEADADLAGHG